MAVKLEDKERVLGALRSGRYRQGRGRIWKGSDDTYCGLGVCARALGMDWSTWLTSLAAKNFLMDHGFPETVCNRVVQLNDLQRWTFPEIAWYLEKYLPVVDETEEIEEYANTNAVDGLIPTPTIELTIPQPTPESTTPESVTV